jgi:hypothetical protein
VVPRPRGRFEYASPDCPAIWGAPGSIPGVEGVDSGFDHCFNFLCTSPAMPESPRMSPRMGPMGSLVVRIAPPVAFFGSFVFVVFVFGWRAGKSSDRLTCGASESSGQTAFRYPVI